MARYDDDEKNDLESYEDAMVARDIEADRRDDEANYLYEELGRPEGLRMLGGEVYRRGPGGIQVYVRAHVRRGRPVRAGWRSISAQAFRRAWRNSKDYSDAYRDARATGFTAEDAESWVRSGNPRMKQVGELILAHYPKKRGAVGWG